MKLAGKCWLLFGVVLAPTPAHGESVTQFAPVDEASSPPVTVESPSLRPDASAPSAVQPQPVNGLPAATAYPAAPAVTPPVVPARPSSPPASAQSPQTSAAVASHPYQPRVTAPSREPARQLALAPRAPETTDSGNSDDNDDGAHYVSLSFSLARAVASLYEVTGEVALGRHFGLALLGGVGSLETKHPQYDQTVELSGKELGAQARIYLLGGFDHGLMLGGEVLRVWADLAPTEVTDPSVVTIDGRTYGGTAMLNGTGTLTGLGAFIGYKVIASFGLTFDAKLGWQSLTLAGTGSLSGEAPINGQNVRVSETGAIRESRGVPLFNLNLGWSI